MCSFDVVLSTACGPGDLTPSHSASSVADLWRQWVGLHLRDLGLSRALCFPHLTACLSLSVCLWLAAGCIYFLFVMQIC